MTENWNSAEIEMWSEMMHISEKQTNRPRQPSEMAKYARAKLIKPKSDRKPGYSSDEDEKEVVPIRLPPLRGRPIKTNDSEMFQPGGVPVQVQEKRREAEIKQKLRQVYPLGYSNERIMKSLQMDQDAAGSSGNEQLEKKKREIALRPRGLQLSSNQAVSVSSINVHDMYDTKKRNQFAEPKVTKTHLSDLEIDSVSSDNNSVYSSISLNPESIPFYPNFCYTEEKTYNLNSKTDFPSID